MAVGGDLRSCAVMTSILYQQQRAAPWQGQYRTARGCSACLHCTGWSAEHSCSQLGGKRKLSATTSQFCAQCRSSPAAGPPGPLLVHLYSTTATGFETVSLPPSASLRRLSTSIVVSSWMVVRSETTRLSCHWTSRISSARLITFLVVLARLCLASGETPRWLRRSVPHATKPHDCRSGNTGSEV